MNSIRLGQKIKDRITGLTGIATGRVEYITGCNQILIQPPVKSDGDFVQSHWIDEDRIESLGDDVISLTVTAAGPDKPAPRR